jgi:hypothetical protein
LRTQYSNAANRREEREGRGERFSDLERLVEREGEGLALHQVEGDVASLHRRLGLDHHYQRFDLDIATFLDSDAWNVCGGWRDSGR